MMKRLLILSALLLAGIGAWAQETTAYKFVCTDWGSMDTGRVEDANVTHDETNNTITVAAGTGVNNVALSNGREAPFSTANYTVTNEQHWLIVVGTNLSTAEGDSDLWWMNGYNDGLTAYPTEIVTLDDGSVALVWDLRIADNLGRLPNTNLQNDVNNLDGWTGFGLTSTTGTSVISNICFYTLEEAIEAYPELSGVLHDATPYEFVCTDWVTLDVGRVTQDKFSYDEDANTITVEASGTNNVAIGNSLTAAWDQPYNGVTTANYYVTNEQCWFVVVGTNISTADGDSELWWMDGVNWGEWDPTKVVTLSDGQVLVAWDLSTMTEIDVNLQGTQNTLSGWTGFGLTSTTGTSVISNINFYTWAEAVAAYPELVTPYVFVNTDWVILSDHTDATAVANNDNTITITTTANSTTSMGITNGNETPRTTHDYYVTNEQCWFVVVGTNLSTAEKASELWWMNGANDALEWDPTEVVTLSDGQVLVAWNLSTITDLDEYLQNAVNPLDGWTCFGLTSTTGSSVISDINFYTENEVHSMIYGTSHFCEANADHWTSSIGNDAFWVDIADKDDGSGMEAPFLTYYVYEGDGATLQDATFTHETLTLEPGLYKVSMDIRIIDYDEGKTIGEGTTFNANGVSQDIELGVDANETSFYENGDHDDIYGTYTLYVTVADDGSGTGSLTVSLDVKDATYNWIMWKNLTVTAIDEEPTVTWTLGADYGTMLLPFDYDLSSTGLTVYTAGEVTTDSDGESVLTLTEVEDGKLTAGTPYIIGGTASETTFSGMPTKYEVSYTVGCLTGVLVDTYAPANSYVLQLQGEEPAFYIVGSDETILVGAYHCYLNYTAPSGVKSVSIVFGDNTTTGIDAVESEAEAGSGVIYDLSGRKVAKAQKGIYIVDGKKVVIK